MRKLIILIPVVAILYIGVSCVNEQTKSDVITAVELSRMNVLYIGISNPIKIAASAYEASELNVSINNGEISGSNGEYNVLVKQPGTAIVTISCNGKEIQKKEFRVKRIPDPVAAITTSSSFLTGGDISKKDLLAAGGIIIVMRDFDFDIKFDIVSFELSTDDPNLKDVQTEISKSDKFSDKQIDLINSLEEDQKLFVENIKAIGPDGRKRYLGSIVFTVNGK